jgi:hypothetical protein
MPDCTREESAAGATPVVMERAMVS